MKKTTCFAILAIATLFLSSCKKDDDPAIVFNQSSVSLKVGESKTVSFTLQGVEEGYYEVKFTASPAGLISGTSSSMNTFTITGLAVGEGVVGAYLDEDPSVTGKFEFVVTQ